MSVETPSAPPEPRRIGPITLPPNLGPLILLIVSAIAIGAVLWGELFADPGVEVRLFDAGAEEAILDQLRADGIIAYPEENLYLVALEDGRLRAIDGRVESSDCNVEFLPDDPRGQTRNPFHINGVLADPCSGAVWSIAGDAIVGIDEPLRTPSFSLDENEDGVRHLYIEVISVGED